MGLLLVIVCVLLLFGGLPHWGYHTYGYAPSSVGFIIVVILVVLLVTGRL